MSDTVEVNVGKAGPWTFEEARLICKASSVKQDEAEQAMVTAYKGYAEAEEAYRRELAMQIIHEHDEAGVAWSAAPDLARGHDRVAELRRLRDIAEGVKEAAEQACWRRVADRKDAQRFADWSQRRELAEGYGQVPEPEGERPIGAQR